jgi:hypothetical protein
LKDLDNVIYGLALALLPDACALSPTFQKWIQYVVVVVEEICHFAPQEQNKH